MRCVLMRCLRHMLDKADKPLFEVIHKDAKRLFD